MSDKPCKTTIKEQRKRALEDYNRIYDPDKFTKLRDELDALIEENENLLKGQTWKRQLLKDLRKLHKILEG